MHRTKRTGRAGQTEGKTGRERERERETELAIRELSRAIPGYLGGGLIGGQEAVLRLVQLLQHPVPLVLRRPQQFLLCRDVLLQLRGRGGRARAAGTDRVLDTHTTHRRRVGWGPSGLRRRRAGVQGSPGNLLSPELEVHRGPPCTPTSPRTRLLPGSQRAQVHNLVQKILSPWPLGHTLYSGPSLFLGENSMTLTPTPQSPSQVKSLSSPRK